MGTVEKVEIGAATLDRVPERVRASMGGPVPAGTTYSDWFKEQSRERQVEILGPKAMERYENGTPLNVLGMEPRGMLAGMSESQPLIRLAPHELQYPHLAEAFAESYKEFTDLFISPVPAEMGHGPDVLFREHKKRPWSELTSKVIEESKPDKRSGFCLFLPQEKGGKDAPVVMLIQEARVDEWYSWRRVKYWDGYVNGAWLVSAKERVNMALCHELAHAHLGVADSAKHEALTRGLISHWMPHLKLPAPKYPRAPDVSAELARLIRSHPVK